MQYKTPDFLRLNAGADTIEQDDFIKIGCIGTGHCGLVWSLPRCLFKIVLVKHIHNTNIP